MALACAGSVQAQNQQTLLIADTVRVPVDVQYRMFVKQYSTAILDYLKDHVRVDVNFEPANTDLVYSGGYYFQGKEVGETDITMGFYEDKGMGVPDLDKKLDEVKFHVIVEENVDCPPIPMPNTSWGMKRADVIAQAEAEGRALFSDTYFAMHPIDSAYHSYYEFFYTDEFEFPITSAFFNETDQLYSSDFTAANYQRAWDANNSDVSKMLVSKGYELLGKDELGWPVFYNSESKTMASYSVMTMCGQGYLYCLLQYQPEDPDGISFGKAEMTKAQVSAARGEVRIDANGCAGQPVRVFSMKGELLAKGVLNNGLTRFSLPGQHMVLVRVGNTAAIKVVIP